MQNKIFLSNVINFAKEEGQDLKGDFSGVAYSGAIIKKHGFMSNLIVDVDSTRVEKEVVPIFRGHNADKIAGNAKLKVDRKRHEITADGKIFKKTEHGKEIIDLSSEGFSWEMSLGLYDFEIENVQEKFVNGRFVQEGIVLRNGRIREVSFVPLGADSNTSAEVFNIKGENNMLTKEQWIEFACSCGGNKETSPSDLKEKYKKDEEEKSSLKKKLADAEKKLKELEDKDEDEEDEEMKAKMDKLAEENKKLKEKLKKHEQEVRSESILEAATKKGLEFSKEKIDQASETEESASLLLSLIEDMKVDKKIDGKFVVKTEVGGKKESVNLDDSEAIRLKANKLIEEKKASNYLEALEILEKENK